MEKLIVPHWSARGGARPHRRDGASARPGRAELQTEALDRGSSSPPRRAIAAPMLAIQAARRLRLHREYESRKIRRDVRITTIYEGTSEISSGRSHAIAGACTCRSTGSTTRR